MSPDVLRERLFLTVAEAATGIFHVDERTLRRAIEAGQVPAVKIANTTRIPVAPVLGMAGLLVEEDAEGKAPGGGPRAA